MSHTRTQAQREAMERDIQKLNQVLKAIWIGIETQLPFVGEGSGLLNVGLELGRGLPDIGTTNRLKEELLDIPNLDDDKIDRLWDAHHSRDSSRMMDEILDRRENCEDAGGEWIDGTCCCAGESFNPREHHCTNGRLIRKQ